MFLNYLFHLSEEEDEGKRKEIVLLIKQHGEDGHGSKDIYLDKEQSIYKYTQYSGYILAHIATVSGVSLTTVRSLHC